MMHFRSLRTIVALLLAVVVAATACGGATDAADQLAASESDASESSGVETAEAAATNDAEDGDEGDAPKTLDDYLGASARFVRGGGGGRIQGFDTDALAEEQELIQQAIQVCMIEQGFEYTPDPPAGLLVFLVTEDADLTAEAYAETRGFGISTRFDSILEGEVEVEVEVDPNDEYLATLGESDADAWQFALRGNPPQRNEQGQLINPDTGEVIQGGRGIATGGCALEAQTAVRGDLEGLQDLQDEFELLDERIEADPDVVQIRTDWASCMRDGGFAWDTEAEARASFQQEFRPLLRSFFAGGQPAVDGRGGALAQLGEQGLTNEQEIELKAMQDREIAAAIASLACWGEGREEIADITATYEADFIEANRAALEALG